MQCAVPSSVIEHITERIYYECDVPLVAESFCQTNDPKEPNII